jgi:o-succinylbenzoate synthase
MPATSPSGASGFPPTPGLSARDTLPPIAGLPPLEDLPPLAGLLNAAHVVSIPMRVKFRGILERETLLLNGPAGWGEFGAFPEYGDVEASRWLRAAIETGWQGFPKPLRDSIPVNATVPAVPAARVPEILARFGRVDAVKVKVAEEGQSLDDDAARVAAVRAELPGAAIRVDANGGWDVPEAVEALKRLAAFDLEYAEQPVPGIDGLAEVRRRLRGAGTPVLIAADESVRKEDDPLKVARAGAADLIVVKVAPLGGVRRALDIVAQAGLPAVVSSALDTSVGIRAGLALAAALPELPYACGLGTVSLLAADVTTDPLVADDGAIRLRDAVPDEELLARYAAAENRKEWWLARLDRAYAELRRR